MDDEFSTKIREWLSMTKVGRIIEKEIEQAVDENTRKLGKAMLRKKISPEEVAEETGLDLEEVEKLQEEK
ncbi:hypothetical protein [Salicibibacter kimchii]|uniref:hypothetical protein n=1 Tax=Salicibibacter kimchii TaxID=2099786 RepID=UPI00135CD9F7|nr:hypothetical protein [Salicibibacter kimchii]